MILMKLRDWYQLVRHVELLCEDRKIALERNNAQSKCLQSFISCNNLVDSWNHCNLSNRTNISNKPFQSHTIKKHT